jgi:hypothetical protein
MRRSSFAEMAKKELVGVGIADDKILAAQARDSHSQRTHAAAAAAWQTLRESGESPQNVNLFTFGSHARRSRLVFARTAPAAAQTGVISWCPPDYQDEHWWQSSERGEDLIKESVALTFEFLNFAGWLCPYGTAPQKVEPHRSQVVQSPM